MESTEENSASDVKPEMPMPPEVGTPYGVPPYAAPPGPPGSGSALTAGPKNASSVYNLILLGLFLLFIGWVARAINRLLENRDAIDILNGVVDITRAIGIILICIGLVQGALFCSDLTDRVKLGMLIAVGLVFAL